MPEKSEHNRTLADPNIETLSKLFELAANTFKSAIEQKKSEEETLRQIRLKEMELDNVKDQRSKLVFTLIIVVSLISVTILAFYEKIGGSVSTIFGSLFGFFMAASVMTGKKGSK